MGISMALPIIGSVAGNIIDAFSQRSANASNEANVQKQIDFQREQSGSQYQRATKDMLAAGLNPALAYQQGGNTAATGAAAQIQPTMRDTGDKISTALATANIAKQGQLLDAQTHSVEMDAQNKRADLVIKQPEAMWATQVLNQDIYGRNRTTGLEKGIREYGNYDERFEADIASTRAGTQQAKAAAGLAGSAQRLNQQDFLPEWMLQSVLPYANATSRGLNIANQAVNLLNPVRFKLPSRNYDHETTVDRESGMKFERRTYRP